MNIEPSNRNKEKRAPGMGPRRLSVSIVLGMLMLAQVNSQAQAVSPGASGMVDPIVGAWNVLVDVYTCDTGIPIATAGQSLAIYNADGTRHETNATNPALRTPGYGHWVQVAKGEYEFAFKYFRFSPTGAHIGSTVIRHELFLSEDGSSFSSEGPAQFLDPAGVQQFVACASATATRFE